MKTRNRRLGLALALLLWFPVTQLGLGRSFHVSPEGDDGYPGTADRPFASLVHARDAVRALIATGLTENVEVLLGPGTHRIVEPLVLGPEDSGTENFSVTWRAGGPGVAVISGGCEIRDWEETPSGMWKATIPDALRERPPFRQLYWACMSLTRARYPNQDYRRVEQVGEDRRSNFRFRAGDLPSLPDLERLELVFLHDWSITRSPIRSIDHSTRTLTLSYPIAPGCRWAAMDWFEKQPRYFLENAKAFLDAPGEWYADWEEGAVYCHPRKGYGRERYVAVAPLTDQLLVVRGEPDHPVKNLRFIDLRFRHTGWRPHEGVYWGRQACTSFPVGESGHREADPAAVQFDFAENCRLEGCAIRLCGGSGLWLGRSCRDNTVEDVSVIRVGGNGIMIGEGQTRKLADGRSWWEGAPEQCATGNAVRGCSVFDCGREMFGAVGVWVGLAAGTRIEHNTLRSLPYTGVSLGWMWWDPKTRPTPRETPARENVVAYNDIGEVMQVLSDGGGIYTLGNQPGSALRGNVIHDIPRNVGRAESNGMFLDQGTGSFVVEDNLIYNVDRSPFRFHKGWNNTVRNNVVSLPEGLPLVRFNDTEQERVNLANNTMLKSETALKAAIAESKGRIKTTRTQ